MKAKYLALATLAGGLALFGWETISNTALPWHMATMRAFTDSNAVVQAIKANAPQNGVYVETHGVVAAVAFQPDMSDRTNLIGSMIGKQLVLDLALAFVLLLAFQRLPRATTRQYAWGSSVAALVVGASILMSNWIWYGFSASWTFVNLVDRMIGYALLGLVLGGLLNRWSPAKPTTDEWGGVKAQGGLPSQMGAPTGTRR